MTHDHRERSMNRCLRRILLFLPVCLLVGACGNSQHDATSSITIGASPYVRGDLGTLTYRAVDLMVAEAPGLSAHAPVVVGSIANVENIERTSPLGNMVADMIRTRLAQDGYAESDVRVRSSVGFNNGDGEFLLSRNRRVLLPAPDAAVLVTGTFAESVDRVYVSLKMVSATDGRILAGADFVVPTQQVLGLLAARRT
jgi:TolB-like protein